MIIHRLAIYRSLPPPLPLLRSLPSRRPRPFPVPAVSAAAYAGAAPNGTGAPRALYAAPRSDAVEKVVGRPERERFGEKAEGGIPSPGDPGVGERLPTPARWRAGRGACVSRRHGRQARAAGRQARAAPGTQRMQAAIAGGRAHC